MPVAPPKINIKGKNLNKTVTLMNDREFNILKVPGLDEISFEVQFPEHPHPDAEYLDGFQPAGYFLEHLRKLKAEKKEFNFTVSRVMPHGKTASFYYDYDSPNTGSSLVSLEGLDIEEDADEGFWVFAKITLKQWVPHGADNIDITPAVATEGGE